MIWTSGCWISSWKKSRRRAARTRPAICPCSRAFATPRRRPKSASPARNRWRFRSLSSPRIFISITPWRGRALEDLTRDIIARTREHCLRSLSDAKLQPADLDQVILVGGQTRMPLVRRMVAEMFGCAEFEETRGEVRLGAGYHRPAGPRLNTSQNPDEAVALGAAIQAAILGGGFKNMLLLDVTPLSLGLETFGGLMNVIIPRNSTIPVKAGELFTTAVDYQTSMLIHVLQGERELARDNWSLGRFDLEFERAARGVARVGVQFEIDANGLLHVLARDTKTGRQKMVEMKSAVDVVRRPGAGNGGRVRRPRL